MHTASSSISCIQNMKNTRKTPFNVSSSKKVCMHACINDNIFFIDSLFIFMICTNHENAFFSLNFVSNSFFLHDNYETSIIAFYLTFYIYLNVCWIFCVFISRLCCWFEELLGYLLELVVYSAFFGVTPITLWSYQSRGL